MIVSIQHRNIEQETFFWSSARNNCFSGGFGNGKTYVACERQYVMLQTFPGYISLFARQYYNNLKSTTMKTFFKICPPSFIVRHDILNGLTVFRNGSCAMWLHLDAFDEQSLRGLEINSATLDQVEEIQEDIYLVLDARIGRWDGARVPDNLLIQAVPSAELDKIKKHFTIQEVLNNPKLLDIKQELISKSSWPRAADGRFRVRNFMDILCNPENEYHWIYRRYHPNSIEKRKNHFYIERQTDEALNDPETIENMKDRDPEWIARYYEGKWGRSAAQIHSIRNSSIIDPAELSKLEFEKFLQTLLSRGALYRVLDHGETSPTCCLWFAALNKVHVCYREYYVPDQPISFHRAAIWELSRNPFTGNAESYEDDIADPSIFHKRHGLLVTGKNNFKTSIADEYATDEIDGPPIVWSAGDNNELATRNRINEILKDNSKFAHPISKESPAPGLYFIRRSDSYPFGCDKVIIQVNMQRREALGSVNGRTIYSDDRDKSVDDHAYDPVRYYVADHSTDKPLPKKDPPKRSFATFERLRLALKRQESGPNI